MTNTIIIFSARTPRSQLDLLKVILYRVNFVYTAKNNFMFDEVMLDSLVRTKFAPPYTSPDNRLL